MVKQSDSPEPPDGEVVQLDMLNDLIQQPVRHGVKICKRVALQKEIFCQVRELFLQITHHPCRFTWFRSDMRKSSLDPGRPNSMKVFTSRRSALFPGRKEEVMHCDEGKRRHTVMN